MDAIKQLEQLREGMAGRGEKDSLHALARFLDQLSHDLSLPVGTFGFEIFTLEEIADRLPEAIAKNDLASVAGQAKRLGAICTRLDGAHRTAALLLQAVDAQQDLASGQRTDSPG
jgi:hypothetical protein